MKKHFTIPFFISHKGCPQQCIFCDQNRITGQPLPDPEEIDTVISRYLETIGERGEVVEVGFFGGSFTGLSVDEQQRFLDPVQKHIEHGSVSGIRISTRPDYIDGKILKFLKGKKVSCIELGVQSASESVLKTAKRGHGVADVIRASGLVTDAGIRLGHQMMLGLPGSTLADEINTAVLAYRSGAEDVRIYPVIVIHGTELAAMWKSGRFTPLDEGEAVERAARLILFFSSKNIRVIRCGLHPSEELTSGGGLLAGPFHPAFRAKAESRIFSLMLEHAVYDLSEKVEGFIVNSSDEGSLRGFGGENMHLLKSMALEEAPAIFTDENLMRGELILRSSLNRVHVKRRDLLTRLIPEGSGSDRSS